MNIFVTHRDPRIAAVNLDDKRVVKMTLESAQILCTTLEHCGGLDKTSCYSNGKKRYTYTFKCDGLYAYKPTHENHPVSVWTRETRSNYEWLLEHMEALSEEYHFRYGRHHKSFNSMFWSLSKSRMYVPDGELTDFTNCAARLDMDIDYRNYTDVVRAYRAYMSDRWDSDTRSPKWTDREPPTWYRP